MMEEPQKDNAEYLLALTILRHDIRNQLSNIQLSLEELRHELPDTTEDITFYMDTIAASCKKINTILKDKE